MKTQCPEIHVGVDLTEFSPEVLHAWLGKHPYWRDPDSRYGIIGDAVNCYRSALDSKVPVKEAVVGEPFEFG